MNDWRGPHTVSPHCDCPRCAAYQRDLERKMAWVRTAADSFAVNALLGQTIYPDEPDADTR